MNASPLLNVRRSLRTSIPAVVSAVLWIAAPFARGFDSTPYPDAAAPDGSASHPWKVNQPQDFDQIGLDGVHAVNHNYLLTTDLDFGDQDHRCRVDFGGNFDGGYHTISRIRIDKPANSYVCLFRSLNVGGALRRLAIQNSYFRGHSWVAPIVGSLQKESVVQECYSRGNTVIAVSAQAAGGIVSSASYQSPSAVVRNSFSRDNIISCAHQTVGGISGYHDARVEFCYTAGNTLTAPWYVGGIVGYGVGTGSIAYSYSDKTNAPSLQTGGFNGSWVNALVPDRNTSGFDITGRSIAELNWDPAVWSIGPDGYPWLTGFNLPPVANAGSDQNAALGSSVYFDGSGSSDDHTPPAMLGFAWSVESAPPGSSPSLAKSNTPYPKFASDVPGTYSLKLVVSDERGATGEDFVIVNVLPPLTNGSFESGFDDWNVSGNVSIQSNPPYSASDGSSIVSFNDGNRPPNGVLTHAFATIPGQIYLLEFDVGVLAYNTRQQRLGLDIPLGSQTISDTIILNGTGGGQTTWLPKQYYLIVEGDSITVTFRDLSVETDSIDLLLDHVRISCVGMQLIVTSEPETSVDINICPPIAVVQTPFDRNYFTEDTVDLGAPEIAFGRSFFGWMMDGDAYSYERSIAVPMTSAHRMTAVFWGGDPIITAQPTSTASMMNGTAGFHVAASGGVPLSYQWQLDGSDIPGATNANLVIAPVTTDDVGTYTVVVTNSQGSATSNPAELTIDPSFALLRNGSFESDFDGWTVGGNVSVESSPPYAATDGVKLAAFNSVNTTPNGSLSQQFATVPGQAYALAFDVGALAYNTRVQQLAVAIIGPSMETGTQYSIQGTTGGQTMWQSHQIPFTAEGALTTVAFRDASEATDAIDLVIDNVRVTPMINRTIAVATSPLAATVTYDPPDFRGNNSGFGDFSITYPSGTAVTLAATTPTYTSTYPVKGIEYRFVKWQKDGSDYSSDPTITLTPDANLQMTAVYQLAPLYIRQQPADLFVPAGQETFSSFDVQAGGGSGGYHYQWQFNGADIPGATDSIYGVNGTLYPAGSYRVVVTCGSESVTSDPALLTIVPVSLANGSFESGFTGWSNSGNVRIQSGTPAPDGNKVAGFNAGNSTPNGTITQTLSTTAGATYELGFMMGVFAYNTHAQRLQVDVKDNTTLASRVYTMGGAGAGASVWVSKTLTFTAAGSSTTIQFTDVSTTTNAIDLLLDKVTLKLAPSP